MLASKCLVRYLIRSCAVTICTSAEPTSLACNLYFCTAFNMVALLILAAVGSLLEAARASSASNSAIRSYGISISGDSSKISYKSNSSSSTSPPSALSLSPF